MFENVGKDVFYKKLKGVIDYVYGIKYDKNNPEIGYLYDNKIELAVLMQMYQNLGIENPEAEFYLNELKKDVDEFEYRKDYPVRNPEEEDIYRRIVGVNSFAREEKRRNPNYIFDNYNEVEGLLRQYEQLKIKNPNINSDITGIMYLLTRDIKKFIEFTGNKEWVNEYQQRLDNLGIVYIEMPVPQKFNKQEFKTR